MRCISAFGVKEEIINCYEAGIIEYILKPIQRAILEEVLKDWLMQKNESY